MESVLDLWRLAEDSQGEISNRTHYLLMTPSGDAPIPTKGQTTHMTPEQDDDYYPLTGMSRIDVDPESNIGVPKQYNWKRNGVPAIVISNAKPADKEEVCEDRHSSQPCVECCDSDVGATTKDDAQHRREILFQIERLLLEARPYDSIGFYYVQRELLHYLQLGEFQESDNSTYL